MRKVLVAGSDSAPCREVVAQLTGIGYQCAEIPFGENILAALDLYAPDALIVEIPASLADDTYAVEGVFSLMLAARLQCANLPVLVMGSKEAESISQRARQLGMLGFIEETFQIGALDALLAPAIEQKRAIDLRVLQSNNFQKRGSRYPWALRMEAAI